MKTSLLKQTFLVLILISFLSPLLSFAQILNDEINVGIKPDKLWSDDLLEGSSGNGNGEGNFKAFLSYQQSGIWGGQPCFTWSIPDPDVQNTLNAGEYTWDYQFNVPFNESVSLSTIFWENDSNACTYHSSTDDNYFDGGYAQFSWGWLPPQTSFTEYGVHRPSRWRGNHNPSNDNWLMEFRTHWDLKVKTAWRYTAGNVCDFPLEFGEIPENTTVSHENANKTDMKIETPTAEGVLTYSDEQQGPSADVFYSFYINETFQVTISTDNSNTGFNTHIYLYSNNCNDLLFDNDDKVPGSIVQSEITEYLTAGTYIVQVEGFQAPAEGDFELTISTGASTVGIDEQDISDDIMIFPNPAKDAVTVRLRDSSSEIDIRIVNVLGQVVFETSDIYGPEIKLPLQNMDAGIYTIIINEGPKVGKKTLVVL